MTQILGLIIRFLGISIGFFFACLVAALVYAFISGLITVGDFDTYNDVEVMIALLLNLVVLTTSFAQLAFVPAFICIIIFEIKRVRDWLYYIVASALIALAVLFFPQSPDGSASDALLYIASAMVGGFIYWLFVGQRAGNWQRKKRDE